MSDIKRFDTSAKYSEMVVNNGTIYLAGAPLLLVALPLHGIRNCAAALRTMHALNASQ